MGELSEGRESRADPVMDLVARATRQAEQMIDAQAEQVAARQSALNRRRVMIGLAQRQGLLAVLAVLVVIFWTSNPYFMTVGNWSTIGRISAILGILAVSQTLLVIAGEIDISVGSVVACSSALIGLLVQHHLTSLEASLIVLAGGVLVGLVTGAIIVYLEVNSLVTTLGMYSILLGVGFLILGTQTLPVNSGLFSFLAGQVGPVPWMFILFLVIWAVGLALSKLTAVGRHIYAIGDSEEAAKRAGVNTARVRIGLYVASGALASFGGVLTTAELNTASPQVGATYLLSVVTAVVLGGTRLTGGRGGLMGTMIAIAILSILQNGFALLQVSSYAQNVVLGGLLILAVLVDQTTSRFER